MKKEIPEETKLNTELKKDGSLRIISILMLLIGIGFFIVIFYFKTTKPESEEYFTKYEDGTQVGTIFQSTENDLVIGNDTNNALKLCFKKDDGLYYKAILIHRDDNVCSKCSGENVIKISEDGELYVECLDCGNIIKKE